MPEDTNPNGSEVVQPGVAGLGDFFNQLGGIAVTGISRRVDLEFFDDEPKPNPDRFVDPSLAQSTVAPGFGQVFANLTPLQWAGIAVALGLSVALATGVFRR